MAIVHSHWASWPRLIPQHGPGRKHLREIRLEPDQRRIIEQHAGWFLRGLIESDGCRHRRIVRETNYPAYSFKNRSEDILRLFSDFCAVLGIRCRRSNVVTLSIARREDVATVDAIMDADRSLTAWCEPSTDPYADSPPCSRSRLGAPSPTPTRG
jgi:hypothetical protein